MAQNIDLIEQVGKNLIATTPLVGMSIGVAQQNGQKDSRYLGQMDDQPQHPVTADTIYDIASLTKLYTTAAYVRLMLTEQLDLQTPLKKILPDFNHEQITLKMLLQHTSGLPSSVRQTKHLTVEMLNADLFNRTLQSEPGTEIHYSDVGFMLLGKALSVLMDEPLAKAMQHLVFEPLKLTEAGYRNSDMPEFLTLDQKRFAPTENVLARGGLLQGQVDDFKAHLLGDAAGHAGIFSTLQAAQNFVQAWLTDDMIDVLQANRFDFRTLGWHYWRFGGEDHPSVEKDWLYQTGFTGTIMALNLKTHTGLVVLTNRVYPNRNVYDRWRVDRYRLPQAFFAQ